ncbi:MAG: hypothetical protein ACTSX2_06310 [Candidatus Thorarchaeota archaeon]
MGENSGIILKSLVVIFLVTSLAFGYIATDGFKNNPFERTPTTPTTTTNTTIPVQQGVKVTGTAIYANGTPVNGYTLYGLDSDDVVQYLAAVTNGAFTSNRGPASGGTFDFYMEISGCILYVGQQTIPSAASYDQESVNIGSIKVYTASSTWTAQLIGAQSNSFTSGGSPGSTNYTQSANVEQTYTLRLTNTEDYSTLFRQYTDPRDDIPIAPVLWLEVASANAYTNTAGIKMFRNTTATVFLIPLSSITCESTINVASSFDFSLVLPTAGTYKFGAYIVDGSNLDRIYTAQSMVSDPNTGEVVSTTQIVNAYCIVS